jgi:predicted phage terminase large subunit-like protein
MESLLDLPVSLSRKDKETIVGVLAEKSRRHFVDFCRYSNKDYQDPPHICHLIEKLEEVERGDLRRLMVFEPPRHGKSETISKKFPAWYLGKHPDNNVIMSSYGFTLVRSFSKDVRDLIESRRYKIVFDISTADDSRQVKDWDIAGHTGGLLAQGVGGSITGYGAHLFIIDDPFKDQKEAESQLNRDKVWDWFRSVVLTRLEPNAAIIIVMTRWHQDDLAGRILAEEKLTGIKEWEVINFPALATADDILGRKEGEALWPERYSTDVLLTKKRAVGSRVWSALYQGMPQDPESQKFKREWFEMYDNLPAEISARGAGADTATSLKSSNDNTSLVDVCRDGKGFLYVEDCFCEKITVSGFAKHLSNQHQIKKYNKVKLEKNNAGEAFKQRIDEVAREESIKTGMPVAIPVECEQTSTDKMVRAMEFQPLVENGTLRFKRGHAKIAELIEHLINFDGNGGDIDDDVDALGFAIKAVLMHDQAEVYVSTRSVY